MDYYFSTTLYATFAEAKTKTMEALKAEGFGIVSEIDMQAKLKEKLGTDFKKYTILGACNPGYAFKAIQTEEKVGTMLPCNIVIIDKENGTTEVSAINPVASMMAIENSTLQHYANDVTIVLRKVIESL